jgi:hypothetical protein
MAGRVCGRPDDPSVMAELMQDPTRVYSIKTLTETDSAPSELDDRRRALLSSMAAGPKSEESLMAEHDMTEEELYIALEDLKAEGLITGRHR